MFVSIEALRLLQELADQLCPSQPAVSEGVLEFINHLESESFNGWSKEEKRGYLTACGSIKGYLSTPTEQPKQELGDNLVEMISRDNKSLKKAGMNLAEAASYVIKEYDGIHRLSLAISEWYSSIGNQGDRDTITHSEVGDMDLLNWLNSKVQSLNKSSSFYGYVNNVYKDHFEKEFSEWLNEYPTPTKPVVKRKISHRKHNLPYN